MHACFVHIHTYAPTTCLVPREAKRVWLIPGTGVTGTCEPPRGSWGSNSHLLEEQPMLVTARPSLQSPEIKT